MRNPRNTARALVLMLLAALALSPPQAHAGARPDTYPKRSEIDVEEYVFRLWLSDDSDRIEGLTTIDLRVVHEGVEEIAFDLTGLRDDGTGMVIEEVRVADGLDVAEARRADPTGVGQRVPFTHRADRVEVPLPQRLTAGERLAITVRYAGIPATGLIIGDNKHGDRSFFSDNWPNRARNWLPTIDHVYDKARSQMIVTAPAHYQVVSNGLLVEERDLSMPSAQGEAAFRVTHWRQGVPIAPWLYVLGAARFAVQQLAPFDGKPVQTWVYADDRDAGFFDFAVPTHDVLAFYSERIGPYAYEKLANIQSNSVGGGMEAASAIFYGDDSVTGERSVRWRNVIIHEIAHQWFGNAVTEADWDDVWLSEGFATYFTLLFIEHAYGRDEFVTGLHRSRERILSFYADNPDYRIVHENLDDMSQVTTGMTYQKGGWVLHMLRDLLGDETFWEGIRLYYARHFNGHATTDDFREAMQEVSGRDLRAYFQQWLYQGRNPRLEIAWRYDSAAGEVELTIDQTQGGDALFEVPLTIEFDDGEARDRSVIELPALGRSVHRVPVSAPPEALRVDPDTRLLARIVVSSSH